MNVRSKLQEDMNVATPIGGELAGPNLVDRPTQLICISDIYVNRQIQKTYRAICCHANQTILIITIIESTIFISLIIFFIVNKICTYVHGVMYKFIMVRLYKKNCASEIFCLTHPSTKCSMYYFVLLIFFAPSPRCL